MYMDNKNLYKLSKVASAILIKGNPEHLEKNKEVSEEFYDELIKLLKNIGYSVNTDAGEPYTEPPKANVWLGHSRGMDRLRFADKDTKTIRIDDYLDEDHYDKLSGNLNPSHYKITPNLLAAINELTIK